MKKAAIFAVLAVLASWLLHSPVFAIYKWVDGQGNIHFTDYPDPANRPAEPEPQNVPDRSEAPSRAEQVGKPAAAETKRVEPLQPAPKPVSQTITQQTVTQKTPAAVAAPVSAASATAQAAILPFLSQTPSAPTASTRSATARPEPAKVTQPAPGTAIMLYAALLPIFAGFIVVILAVLAVLFLFFSLCLFLIAKKLEVSAAWTAWVPLLSLWAFVASARKSGWWIVLLFIPVVNFFVGIYLWMCICENLGRNKMLGLLMLLPLVNLVWLGILAFSRGEEGSSPAPAF